MRLLIDANLSPRIAERLRAAGYDTDHVDGIGIGGATDTEMWTGLTPTATWS